MKHADWSCSTRAIHSADPVSPLLWRQTLPLPRIPDAFLRCVRPLTVLLLLLLFSTNVALALDRTKTINQYGHDAWTSQDGLPGQAVYEILQTPDGYLWMRTSAGLVRFDGVRLVLTDLVVNNEPVREAVKAICKSADGDLLVRTTSRTLIYKNGVFSDYRKPAPLPDGGIRILYETREHEVFLGSDDFVYLIQDSGPKLLRRGTAWTLAFFQDHEGTLWVSTGSGLYSYKKDELSASLEQLPGSLATAFAEDQERTLWVGTQHGLYHRAAGQTLPVRVVRGLIRGQVSAMCTDRQGNLWVATDGAGLLRLTADKWSSFTVPDGLTDNSVLSIYEDREGSLWVGTANGLDRFRDTKVTTLTTKEAVPTNNTRTVIEAPDGSVYVFADGGGLARIRNGVVTPLIGLSSNYGGSLFFSKDGSLWIGTGRGLNRFKD